MTDDTKLRVALDALICVGDYSGTDEDDCVTMQEIAAKALRSNYLHEPSPVVQEMIWSTKV